ncbi:hypothetical protein NC652_027027 [Populus alba x Populus x berolinensis]|nr:hypothetical protein NC652_027027 [Populus alba x Populus x berolinensis]
MRFRTTFIQNEGPSVHFDASRFDGDDLLGVSAYSSLRDDYVEDFSVRFVDYSRWDNSSYSSGAGR